MKIQKLQFALTRLHNLQKKPYTIIRINKSSNSDNKSKQKNKILMKYLIDLNFNLIYSFYKSFKWYQIYIFFFKEKKKRKKQKTVKFNINQRAIPVMQSQLNWDSLHARLNSHYEAWSYKKRSTKKITGYRKSV